MDKKITQERRIKTIFAEYGSITRNQALRMYISRLGAIIHTLRHRDNMQIDGYYIKTKRGFDYKYELIKKK
jgi:hypothetical protein